MHSPQIDDSLDKYKEQPLPQEKTDAALKHMAGAAAAADTMRKALRITPLGDKVVVKPMPVDTVSAGGIIIPDNARQKPDKGIVAAGTAVNEESREVLYEPGYTVLYNSGAGSVYEEEGEKYLIMRAADLIAVIAQRET